MVGEQIKFGIIGGNGVITSNYLLEMLTRNLIRKGATLNVHHPEVISYQSPSRSLFLEGKGEDFTEDYIKIAKHLKEMGCHYVAIPCIAAHYSIDVIEREAGIACINLLDEAVKTIASNFPESSRIAILCTKGARDHKLFDPYLKKWMPKSEVVYPDDKHQQYVMQGIVNTNKGMATCEKPLQKEEAPSYCYQQVLDHLSDDVDLIVLGCTDIRIGFDDVKVHSHVVDSLDVLCRAMARIYLFESNFPKGHPFYKRESRIWEDTNIDISTTKAKILWEERGAEVNKAVTHEDTLSLQNIMLASDAEYVNQFNQYEIGLISPLLKLDAQETHVLDIGCGLARWLPALEGKIKTYTGIDGSEGYIRFLQQKYNQSPHYFIATLFTADTSLEELVQCNKYQVIIVNGLFVYLNDNIMENMMSALPLLAAPHAQIYLRESVSVMHERLTLLDDYSEVLKKHYSAIYRTPSEYYNAICKHFYTSWF